jgi:hypothetical protein
MADAPPVTVRPGISGSSATFLCGTAGWADGFLSQARKWAQAIQKSAGGPPGVNLGDMSKDVSTVANLVDRFSADGGKQNLAVTTLDTSLGGLRGHTLIFVTHGLESHDPKLSPEEKDRTQGLLFFNQAPGDDPRDRVLIKFHLDFMAVNPAKDGKPEEVVPVPDLDTRVLDDGDGKQFKKNVRDFAPVVSALRRSVFARVYLAACGGGRRLEKFSARLRELTRKEIYWNDDTISMPTPPVPPFAEVGQIVNGTVPNLRQGTRYFKPRDAANLVDLRTKTDTFFEGSMSRIP